MRVCSRIIWNYPVLIDRIYVSGTFLQWEKVRENTCNERQLSIVRVILMRKKGLINSWNRAIDSICSLLRTKNVSTRLKMGFILITVLPVIAVGYFSYMQGSKAIYNKMKHSVTETIDQVGIHLGSKLQAIINDGTEIAYNDLVQKTLINYDSLSARELNIIEDDLSDYINRKYIFSNNVAEIIIYTNDLERINAYGQSMFWFMPKPENLEQLAEKARELDGLCLWMPVNSDYEQGLARKVFGDRKSIILMRNIKSLETGNQIGYILMRIDESVISDTLRNIDFGEGAQIFVLNSSFPVKCSKYGIVHCVFEKRG